MVKGSFNNVQSFEPDTILQNNQFTYSFNPGQYQWSLRAFNNEYSTNYIVRSFTIDSISDISQNSVLLNFPINNAVYGDSNLTFSWKTVFSATKYFVQLIDKSDGKFILNDTVITTSISTGSVLKTKIYEFKVMALNDQSQTVLREFEFEVDLNSPGTPRLLTPNNLLIPAIGPVVDFSWTPGQDDHWSYDSIYVYPVAVSNTPIIARKVSDSFFVDSSFSSGINYKWRVKSFDIVGNASNFSATNDFSIQ
ncbi:MAG: hypothetical protein ACI9DK_001070 [Vicingaceae bacterium]